VSWLSGGGWGRRGCGGGGSYAPPSSPPPPPLAKPAAPQLIPVSAHPTPWAPRLPLAGLSDTPGAAQVKQAIEKGNIEGAKVYAQNAIRKKSEALNYLQLASRLDGVVSRLDTQAKMNTVNRSMAGVVKSLEKALGANNLEMVSRTMDQFERQFESLDVQSECVEQAMASQQALSTPAGEVNELMQQVADEHGLELGMDLPTAERIVPEKEEESSLNDRLAQLKAR